MKPFLPSKIANVLCNLEFFEYLVVAAKTQEVRSDVPLQALSVVQLLLQCNRWCSSISLSLHNHLECIKQHMLGHKSDAGTMWGRWQPRKSYTIFHQHVTVVDAIAG